MTSIANAQKPSSLVTKEYQGAPFVFREDGYFNMTKAAKHFGKRIDHFIANADTKEYIKALDESLVPGKSGTKGNLIWTMCGNGSLPGVGTWGHPKLAVFFARWLDVRFAVWCDMVIDDILHKKAELVITKPEESAVLALPESHSATMFALAESMVARARLLEEREKQVAELAAFHSETDWMSVDAWRAAVLKQYLSQGQKAALGKLAKLRSAELGLPARETCMTDKVSVGKLRIPMMVGVYRRDVLTKAAAELGILAGDNLPAPKVAA